MTSEANRRASFRVDDTMSLRINPLEPKRLDEILQNFDAYRLEFCLKSHFVMQRELRQGSLQLIRNRDQELANYLQHLENQMLLLAERMSGDGKSSFAVAAETEVSLSSTGIRFHTTEQLSLGQVIELGMRLSSSDTQIIVIATVARLDTVENDGNASQHVSLTFSQIHQDDSEAIIRHMFKLQQLQLQARRAGSDPVDGSAV